ncbi:MAG: polysaccharide deacetylase family protein [Planctomycetota bacterium]
MKRIASLSLDLDNQWSYMKTHGDAGWEEHPSYLDLVVPRVLEMLARLDLKITFFVVGQDAALEKNHDALAQLAAAGHEIGNHSFHHEPWLHLYSEQEVHEELARAEDVIEQATGVRPDMFRGPGYSLSPTVLQVLHARGYRFDASTMPTYLGPLARAYYLRTAKLEGEERERRAKLFGTWKDGLQPIKPYFWDLPEDQEVLEIPVTTFPWLKFPFHLSYVLYLSTYSKALASLYFRMAVRACRMARFGPALLLHPLDFLSAEDVQGLEFFPGMRIPTADKLTRVEGYLKRYSEAFEVLPMGAFTERLLQSEKPSRRRSSV